MFRSLVKFPLTLLAYAVAASMAMCTFPTLCGALMCSITLKIAHAIVTRIISTRRVRVARSGVRKLLDYIDGMDRPAVETDNEGALFGNYVLIFRSFLVPNTRFLVPNTRVFGAKHKAFWCQTQGFFWTKRAGTKCSDLLWCSLRDRKSGNYDNSRHVALWAAHGVPCSTVCTKVRYLGTAFSFLEAFWCQTQGVLVPNTRLFGAKHKAFDKTGGNKMQSFVVVFTMGPEKW